MPDRERASYLIIAYYGMLAAFGRECEAAFGEMVEIASLSTRETAEDDCTANALVYILGPTLHQRMLAEHGNAEACAELADNLNVVRGADRTAAWISYLYTRAGA